MLERTRRFCVCLHSCVIGGAPLGVTFGLTYPMEIVTIILMLVPFVFASARYVFPYNDAAGAIAWLWAISAVACFGWGFFIRRRYPGRAWACVVIGFIQLALIVLPNLKPEKSRSLPGTTAHATRPNQITSLDAASPFRLHVERQWCGASEFFRWA